MAANDTLTAADVMTPAPRTCSPFSTVLEAVLIFRDADCGAVPVTRDGEAVGILTDRDVALALADHPDLATRSVGEIMTEGVVTVRPEDTIESVRAKFGEAAVRRLLVVDAAKQLVGIIAWADLAPRLSDRTVGQVVTDVVEKP